MRKLRILVAIAGGLAVAIAAASAAPRAGKVIRVERKAASFTGSPRHCHIQPTDLSGLCWGKVEIGDRYLTLDRNRVLGVLRVTHVQQYQDNCQQFFIQSVAESGDFDLAQGLVLGVADVTVDPRAARLVDPDRSPTGHQWGTDAIYAVDNTGDGNPEIEFIQYSCDDSGNATTSTPTSLCHEVWIAPSGRNLERVRQERFKNCY
jgi:hypothetical protein